MKFKTYLQTLNDLAEEFPEYLEFDVITASDDEGNDYNFVNYKPSVGYFDNVDFDTSGDPEADNAICVN